MKLQSLVRQFAPAAILGGRSVRNTLKGDGNVTTEILPVSDFTAIQATGALEIQWSSGPLTLGRQCDTPTCSMKSPPGISFAKGIPAHVRN